MVNINQIISIITLNIKGINTSIKKQTVRMDQKIRQLCAVYKKPSLNIKTNTD